MRTLSGDIADLLTYVDGVLAYEYPQYERGAVHRAHEWMLAQDDLGAALYADAQDWDSVAVREVVDLLHTLAKATMQDRAGQTVAGYQLVIEAYKCAGNAVTYLAILRQMRDREPSTAAATEARHRTLREIKDFAALKYREGAYPSAYKASIEIAEEVRAKATELGKPLSPDRAQKTIYDWLRTLPKTH